MVQSMSLGFFLEQILTNDKIQNDEVVELYNDFLKKEYDFKNFDIVLATDDQTYSKFLYSKLSMLNKENFIDCTGQQIIVNHPFKNYENLLYLSSTPKEKVIIDSSVYVDSNSMNTFNRNCIKKGDKEFLNFIKKNNIDINYLPYILEDYVNPYHSNPNTKMTCKRIVDFEIISNLDREIFLKKQRIYLDYKLLKKEGFNSLKDLIEKRFYYFTHFYLFENTNIIECNNDAIMHEPKTKELEFDIRYFFADYHFVYAFILQIVDDKWKNISTRDKIKNLYLLMVRSGKIYIQILHLAYNYYENQNIVDDFLKFGTNQSFKRIQEKALNISWDISLYLFSSMAMQMKEFRGRKIDFHLPFFLTKDERFFNAFIEPYKQRMIIFDKSKQSSHSVPFYGVSAQGETEKILKQYILDFNTSLNINRQRFHILNSDLNKRLSNALLMSEELEYRIKQQFK